jgi:hypothetical protein
MVASPVSGAFRKPFPISNRRSPWDSYQQLFIPEMVDVLNEGLDAFTSPPFPDFLTAPFPTRDLISA